MIKINHNVKLEMLDITNIIEVQRIQKLVDTSKDKQTKLMFKNMIKICNKTINQDKNVNLNVKEVIEEYNTTDEEEEEPVLSDHESDEDEPMAE